MCVAATGSCTPRRTLHCRPALARLRCLHSIKYTVSGDVVLGLRFKHVVSRMGVNVSTDDVNLGGYPPKAEQYEYSFPADTWPSGMFARGTYTAVVTMTDDDDNEWAKFQYQFTIAKNWA